MVNKTLRGYMKQAPVAHALAYQPSVRQLTLISLLTCVALLLLMGNAYANLPINTAMGGVLCNIVLIVYGNLGRGLACLAVIIIGVGATLGKTSWGLAITVAVGIAVIFNAENVVGYLGGAPFSCL